MSRFRQEVYGMLALEQDSLERRSLARNEVLFRRGDKVTAIYFIEEGQLRLERRTVDGRLLFLGTTPAGEFLVEAALFSDRFHCDAVATERSRVRVYPKAAVLNLSIIQASLDPLTMIGNDARPPKLLLHRFPILAAG